MLCSTFQCRPQGLRTAGLARHVWLATFAQPAHLGAYKRDRAWLSQWNTRTLDPLYKREDRLEHDQGGRRAACLIRQQGGMQGMSGQDSRRQLKAAVATRCAQAAQLNVYQGERVDTASLEVCMLADGSPWLLGQGSFGCVYKVTLTGRRSPHLAGSADWTQQRCACVCKRMLTGPNSSEHVPQQQR